MRGLAAAALVAWALMTASDLLPPVVEAHAARWMGHDGHVPDVHQMGGMLALYAAFGIPVALAVTIPAGLLAWRWGDRRGRGDAKAAIVAGTGTGGALGLISLASTLAQGIAARADHTSSFGLWRWGHRIVEDGMPTAIGWALEIAEWPVTAGIGAVAGWVAWRVTGPRP